MSGKIIAWVSSKGKNLLNKSSRKPKSWAKRIISKLPYQRKLNAKDEWKKANQPTSESHDSVTEKLCAVDNSTTASKESYAVHRTTLMTACHSGDTEKVKSLLEEDVDINEQDEEGTTALILACLVGHTKIVKMLLNKGALIDVHNKEKWTALMKAADNGFTEVVNLLLEHRAEVDTQSEWKKTALMLASQKGHVELVQLLLQHNAGVDLQDYQGWTALMLASKEGHNEVAKLLLQQGANVDLCTEAGTALMWASEEGHKEVAKLLLEHGAQVNMQTKIGETALMWACDAGHSEVAKLLLEYGAQANLQTNWKRETALMRASKKGYDEVVKSLLKHNAQVDLQTMKGETALMWVSEEGHYNVARSLLALGAQVDLQNIEGETALMLASSKGHFEVVELLVKHGAQVLMKDKYGFSILMRACRQGQAEIPKLLLAHGCDVQINEPNSRGETALMYASQGEVAKMLLDNGAQVDIQNIDGRTALMLAASNGHMEVVKSLLEHGAQVTVQDKYGSSALMHACSQSHGDIVKMLLKQGCAALIHQPDNFKKTALMCASEKGHYDVAEVLIENGAQVDFQDKKGRTALIYASKGGHCEVVKLLLQHGAQVDFQDRKGKTALIHASFRGHIQVAQHLLEYHAQIDLIERRELHFYSRNATINSEQTALMMAHNTEAAQILLEHGAQVNKHVNLTFTDNSEFTVSEDDAKIGLQVEGHAEGLTALMLAPEFNKNYEYMKLLLEHGAKVDLQAKVVASIAKHSKSESLAKADKLIKKEIGGVTALMCAAARCSKRKVAKVLLEHGAQIDLQTTGSIEGVTALFLATISNNKKVVEVLLNHGAQVDLQAKGNIHFIFFFASIIGIAFDYIPLKYLLELGALGDLQTKHDVEGFTALMCAIVFGVKNATKLLLEHGAQVNIQAKGLMKGKTALILALTKERYKEVELLLKHGADANLQDDDGCSPLMYAVQAENYLLQEEIIEAVELLIAHGAKVDLQNNDGWTALMYAAQADYSDTVVEILIAQGAKVDLQNNDGWSPLMYAAQANNSDVAKLFIAQGAEVDLQNNEGWSPLMYAVQAEYTNAAELLLTHGANVDLQDDHGWSPLMHAVQAENLEAVELLIAHDANIHLKTYEGKTLHDICSPDLKKNPEYTEALLRADKTLEMDLNFPGMTFFGQPLKETLTSGETTIGQLCDGISAYVPSNALSSEEESAELCIRPCFNGPFELPAEYKPVSPAYLIHHSKTHFQKDITIRMHHYANLQSEEDCEDMAFLTASSTPEYRGEQPVYVFKAMPGARGVFKPEDQVGELSLQHFCLVMTGKQKTTSESEDSSESFKLKNSLEYYCHTFYSTEDLYYSARLYWGAQHDGAVSAAVFCMCLYHPIYIKHCDTMIARNYTGGKSTDFVQVREDSVAINSNDPSGQHVKFDKVPAQILRREVHLPEILNIDVGELLEYPPRLSISIKTSQDFTSPVLQVHGLDKECGFSLLPISTPFITPQVESSSSSVHMAPTPAPLLGTQSQFTEKENAASSAPQSSEDRDTPTGDSMMDASNFLDIDDLSDVLDEVESLSSKWRLLLTKLGVKRSTLECVKTNNAGDVKMCLYEALGEWLMLNYDHQRHGRPSWSKLVKAVSSIDFALSEAIAKKMH